MKEAGNQGMLSLQGDAVSEDLHGKLLFMWCVQYDIQPGAKQRFPGKDCLKTPALSEAVSSLAPLRLKSSRSVSLTEIVFSSTAWLVIA